MIQLREYESRDVELSDQDVRFLLPYAKERDGEISILETIGATNSAGVWRLKAGPYVGRLGLPSNEWIDFQCRFPVEDAIELILIANGSSALVSTLRAEAKSRPSARSHRSLFHPRSRKISRTWSFESVCDSPCHSTTVCGKIDVLYHLNRQLGRPDKLATLVRRLSHSTPENQALALALDVITRVPLEIRLSSALARLGSFFHAVRRVPMSAQEVLRLKLNRLTERYRPALRLAALILSSARLSPESRQEGGASLLFHMPSVWEACVADWVQVEWGNNYEVKAPYSFDLSVQGELKAEADITVWDDLSLIALYDAKYKWPKKLPDTSDVYQMVSYCHRLRLPSATLVYPTNAAPASVEVTGKLIHGIGLVREGVDDRRWEPGMPRDLTRALAAT